eukprot:15366075-Ditylum_brightwellii.AAC.2
MDYFIHTKLWNGVMLVLDKNPMLIPTFIKTVGLDTKVMADFLYTVGWHCNLKTMREVLCNEHDLLDGV